MIVVYLLLGLLPSFLQRPIRNLLGAKIEHGAKISALTLITVNDIRMARGARIGPFVRIKAKELVMGRNACIKGLSIFKARHIEIGRDSLIDPMVLVNSDFGPRSRLELGRSVRIFSFSVIEPSEGVYVGDQSGLGGQCLIFCHGSWPNYLEGAPYARGPVRIADQVWIPWRVMILPNVEIGSGAVIGAHSLVRGKVPAHSLYSGVPAKLIADNIWAPTEDHSEKERRLAEVVESFHAFHEELLRGQVEIRWMRDFQGTLPAGETVLYSFSAVTPDQMPTVDDRSRVTVLDLQRLYYLPGGPIGKSFVRHLATFGVRLSAVDQAELKLTIE